MAVRRRPDRSNEWWVSFRFRGRRVRRRSPIQTQKAAEEFERQLYRELGDDLAVGRDPFAGPPPTLAEFAPRWMREHVEIKERPATAYAREGILRNHLLPVLGKIRLDQISSAIIDDLSAQLIRKPLAPKTVNSALSTLRCCLRRAHRWKLLRVIPEFEWLHVDEQPFRVLSEREAQAVVDAADPGFWQTLVVFILHTGVRFSEAAAVTWDDIDHDRPVPVVRICKGGSRGKPGPTKTGTHREIPLNDVLLDVLRVLPRTADRIFPTKTPHIMDPASTGKFMTKFCVRAGITPCGWHALRHTFATRLAANGVAVQTIQKLLGHTTLEMTMRYIHTEPSTVNATAAIVAAAMASPGRVVHQVSTKPIWSTPPSPAST